MKRSVLLLIVSIFILDPVWVYGQEWEFGYPDHATFESVQQTIDGGYVFAADKLVKTDGQGAIVWESQGLGWNDAAQHVILTQDSGYAVVAGANQISGGRLVKVSANGTIEWNITHANSGINGKSYDVLELADGSLIVWGTANINSNTDYVGHLLKYSAQGTLIWSRFLGGGTMRNIGFRVKSTSDGGFILAGVAMLTSSNMSRLWLVKTDANGYEEWSTVGDEDIGYFTVGNSVFQTADGGYFTTLGNNVYGSLMIYKTDPSGAILWVKEVIADPVHASSFYGRGLIQAPDDGYIVAATAYGPSYWDYDPLLMKINDNGQEVWRARFGANGRERPSAIRATSDGGYIVSGKNDGSPGLSQGYAFKVGPTEVPCESIRIDPQICLGDVFSVGTSIYNETGVYFDTLTSVNGCDSLVATHLTVVEPVNEFNVSICNGATHVVGPSVYTMAGTYVDSLQSISGCDSTVITNLTVTETDTVLNAHICPGGVFRVGNTNYTDPGTYVDTLVTVGGCDSVVVTNLAVFDTTYTTHIDLALCENDYHLFYGWQIITETGTYTATLQSSGGCDSTIFLHATVYPSYDTTINVTICDGEVFGVGTRTHTETGMYVDTYFSQGVCDSVVRVNLTVLPNPNDTTIMGLICNGDSFIVGTQTYTSSGIYNQYFPTSNTCDSVVTIDLTVINQEPVMISPTICFGETFTVGSNTYYQSGTYTDILQSSLGCDSTVITELTVLSVIDSSINATICDGQSFSAGTYTYTSGGTYIQNHISVNGCDSTVTINLTEGQGFEVSLFEMICDGDSFSVGSSTYTQPGIYVDSLVSVGGCDSVITTEIVWSLDNPLGFPITILQGTVFEDNDGNCVLTAGDTPLDTWVVEANGNQTLYGTTNAQGNYSIWLPHGTYDLSAQTPANWQDCGLSPQTITIDENTGCFAEANIGLEPSFGCAILDLNLCTVCLVPCSTSTYQLNYQNIGTETAYNPTITFAAGPYLTVNWSSVPWETPQNGSIYEFHFDSIPAGASGWITIAVTVDCDPSLEGYSICSGALHDAAQCCAQYAQYNGPEVALEAECLEGQGVPEIEFRIKNIGNGDMNAPLPFYILQDDIVYNYGTFQLNSQQQDVHTIVATGNMYRMEAQQVPQHPYAASPAIEVEGCGTNAQGTVSLGYSDMLENGDQIPSIDFNCMEVTQTCMCNMMYASPTGITEQNFVDVDEQIEYTVTFQNQTTSEVQKLVIVDTLPAELDPNTIVKGESSHEFTFSVSGTGIVTWTMENIGLPVGVAGTNDNSGFVKFTADLRVNVPVGSVVTNSAQLYFDEQTEVLTNEVFHTVGKIGEDFLIGLGIDDIKDPDHSLTVFPNPFDQSTSIRIDGLTADVIEVDIFDAVGRVVQRGRANSKQIVTISRNGMTDGIYFYRVSADGKLIGAGKLIVGGR